MLLKTHRHCIKDNIDNERKALIFTIKDNKVKLPVTKNESKPNTADVMETPSERIKMKTR